MASIGGGQERGGQVQVWGTQLSCLLQETAGTAIRRPLRQAAPFPGYPLLVPATSPSRLGEQRASEGSQAQRGGSALTKTSQLTS